MEVFELPPKKDSSDCWAGESPDASVDGVLSTWAILNGKGVFSFTFILL